MPILTVEHHHSKQVGAIAGRVVIGRWPTNGIVIDDPLVSRLHAWIGRNGTGHFIIDLRSRSGTRVNGQFIADRHHLHDGDRIEIGPAEMIFREQDDEDTPAFSPRVLNGPMPDDGILFDCICDTPFWAPAKQAGRVAECRHCMQKITIPLTSGQKATRCLDQAARVGSRGRQRTGEKLCSICQWTVAETDHTMTCPDCGLVFHDDCWRENEGCSAYGCTQVNILRPQDHPHRPAAPTEGEPEHEDEVIHEQEAAAPGGRGPMGMLVGSILAAAASMLTFGVPSMVMLAVAALYIGRRRGEKNITPAFIALGVSLLAMLAGIVVSYRWWL